MVYQEYDGWLYRGGGGWQAEALTDIEMETEVEMQGVGDESCSEQLEEIEPQPKKKLQEEIY